MRSGVVVLSGVVLVAACATAPHDSRSDAITPSCAAAEHRQFDFWIGRWDVAAKGQPPSGFNEITRIAGGCALLERYRNVKGYAGGSLNWYDPERKRWAQQWIDNAGLSLSLEGAVDGRGRIVMTGRPRVDEGKRVLDRIAWARNDGTVHQIWDISSDDGRTWTTIFHGIYTRARN